MTIAPKIARPIVPTLALALAGMPIWGQSHRQKSAQNNPQTTVDMVNSAGNDYEKWDRELNKVYSDLCVALQKHSKELKALRDAQKEWLLFRDKEFELVDALYATKDGSMYRPMRIGDRTGVVKTRVEQLRERLSLLNM